MKLIDIPDDTPLPVAHRLARLTIFWSEPRLRRAEWAMLVCLASHDGLHACHICVMDQPSNAAGRDRFLLIGGGLFACHPDPDDARDSLSALSEPARLIRLLDTMARDLPRPGRQPSLLI
ncbi:hypothetical protein SAMN05421666_2171 [Roseovarius nanhaiticus]|uniref:Uncharacterized protein n=1 Tax=Roseovarius nanhaiticus TaxID=573024 RepID=A0A1N7GWY7_9RHOB|nr:hypothetical protein [Roseovarius nanhaiticus]SEL21273.1 hypothetical protein SAMN05216208_3148 [Roseovarius nanhaiticus]SIS17079.1 hypothetical protein SAMN05421666_2171 [Roseovarius nanhaiticus]